MTLDLNHTGDPEGERTLEVISRADRFNAWMYHTISPFCSGRVLEIGSGIGNISAFFLNNGHRITLSDLRPNYRERLNEKYSAFKNLESVIQLDLVDPVFPEKFRHLTHEFDTVFALNVIEHIRDDSLAIRNCHSLVKPGGNLIILVPAFQSLYNQFDKNLGHYRRYKQQSLNALLSKYGFKIIHNQYFNFGGILGWYVSGTILKKQTIPEGQMDFYNVLVPVFKLIDFVTFNRVGLSVIAVGKAV